MKVLLLCVLLLTGCATAPTPKTLFVTFEAEAMPQTATYRTYLLRGLPPTDLASIKWQKLRPTIVSALEARGLKEVQPPQFPDMVIYIESKNELSKDTVNYTTPNFVFVPQSVSTVNATTSTRQGPVTTQATVTTPAKSVYTGSTERSYDRYSSLGSVRLIANAFGEWVRSPEPRAENPRIVWTVFAGYGGDLPVSGDEMTVRCLDWSLRHAGSNFKWGKIYKTPSDFTTVALP